MITESGTQIAVVANQIIRARHRLDPRQQKTIAWAIAQIPKDATTLDRQTLSIADFARLTDNDSGDIYRQMETVTTSLLRSILEIREPGGRSYTRFQWLSECEYRKGEGTVLLRLHPKLEPYLLELRGRFTRLALEKFFKFRSSYTIRLFERIEMQRGLALQPGIPKEQKLSYLTWTMTLLEIREWLGLEATTYPKFGLLRANVLDIAQRELNTKAEWSFTFKTIKTGKRITGIEFTIRHASKPITRPNSDLWLKTSAEMQTKVLRFAHERIRRWMDPANTDEVILADATFWTELPRILDLMVGQTQLPIAESEEPDAISDAEREELHRRLGLLEE